MKTPVCATVLALTAMPAQCATITIQTFSGRDPVVLVVGYFEPGDDNEFKVRTSWLSSALVVFNSDGGDADAALDIGRIIRARRFATAVTGTNCYSACAIAWLGGVKRYMSADSQIGFHAPFDPNTGLTSDRGNFVLRIYAGEMGLSYDTAKWIIAKGHDEFNILTKAEADRLGIAVDICDAPRPQSP